MADFKVPNLCGASPEFNAIQTKFESMITSALDGLEVDASALKSTLDTDVTSLVGDIKAMIPPLPELPDINLQAQLTSLSGLSIGSSQYNTLLAGITTSFGSALTASGFSLDTLVSSAASAIGGGESLCSSVPNFTVPAAGGDAVQKAVGVKQAAVDALSEEASVLVENTNLTNEKTNIETEAARWVNPDDTSVPTEDVGAFRPTEKTTEIVVADNAGNAVKVEASTHKDLVTVETVTEGNTTKTTTITESGGEVTETKRKNVAPAGITTQTSRTWEDFTKDDVVEVSAKAGVAHEITLKHTPYEIVSVEGWDRLFMTSTVGGTRKSINKPNWRFILSAGEVDEDGMDLFTKSRYHDIYEIEGNKLKIQSYFYTYSQMSQEKADKSYNGNRYIYTVSYRYLDNYDPNVKE